MHTGPALPDTDTTAPGGNAGVSETGPAAVDMQALMALGEALDRLGVGSVRGCVEVGLLAHAFPQWAVWRQADGRSWIAVRPAGSMPPGPEAPMVRVRAGTGCRTGGPDAGSG